MSSKKSPSLDLAFVESSSKLGQPSSPARQLLTSMKDHHPILTVRASASLQIDLLILPND